MPGPKIHNSRTDAFLEWCTHALNINFLLESKLMHGFLIHYRNLKRLILVEISFEEIKCYEICLLCVDTKLIHVALKNIFRIIKKKKKKHLKGKTSFATNTWKKIQKENYQPIFYWHKNFQVQFNNGAKLLKFIWKNNMAQQKTKVLNILIVHQMF